MQHLSPLCFALFSGSEVVIPVDAKIETSLLLGLSSLTKKKEIIILSSCFLGIKRFELKAKKKEGRHLSCLVARKK